MRDLIMLKCARMRDLNGFKYPRMSDLKGLRYAKLLTYLKIWKCPLTVNLSGHQFWVAVVKNLTVLRRTGRLAAQLVESRARDFKVALSPV